MKGSDSCTSPCTSVANTVTKTLVEFEHGVSKLKTLLHMRSVQDEAAMVSRPQLALICGSKYLMM